MAIAPAIIFLIILLAMIAGGIILQIHLSKQDNKYLGLILPCVTFILSLIMMFGIVSNLTYTQSGGELILERTDENGAVTEIIDDIEIIDDHVTDQSNFGAAIALSMLYGNIPTIILLLIYIVARKNKQLKDSKELEKMSIQDLE